MGMMKILERMSWAKITRQRKKKNKNKKKKKNKTKERNEMTISKDNKN